jgi:hypothetical protein
MPTTYIPPEDHLIRYVPWGNLRRDADENVIGVLHIAFRLRDDERDLSATWVEYFGGSNKAERVISAVKAIRASKLKVTPKSGFAIGQVTQLDATCKKHDKKVRFIHEPESDNEAHVAIHGWPRDADDLFEALASESWSETVLNKDIPA